MFPSSLYTCIFSHIYNLYKIQFSSVAQSCPTLCDPMNHSTPGLPIHHELPEFTQTHWNAEVWSQETPGVTGKFALGIRNEAGQRLIRVLPRKCTSHSKHPLPTTQEKTLLMDITRWSTPKSNWLYSLQPKMEKLYTVSKNKTRSWLWLRSWAAYCQIQTEIEESRENH